MTAAGPETWLLRGLALAREGDDAGAEAAFREALAIDAASPEAWKCLGTLLGKRGDRQGAIDALDTCLRCGGPDAGVSAFLGRLLFEVGRFDDSHAAYAEAARREPGSEHFARMDRTSRFLRDMLEGQAVDTALGTFRSAFPSTEAAAPELPGLFEMATAAMTSFGHLGPATRLARRRAELWPESASARYLLASVLGDARLSRSPDAYVEESYNAFADRFDAQLVGELGYDVPEKLVALVRSAASPDRSWEVADVGCGTGLAGPLLRPTSRRLVGVDLASRMLDHAARRAVYDALECAEATAWLERSPGAFDLVFAADVLIYSGNLRPFVGAAASALRAGGLLALSVETADAGDFRLGPTGRFAHAPRYVDSVASGAFEPVASCDTTLRREGRDRVDGRLAVYRRRAG